MGRDIHIHLVKFNRKKDEYEEVELYRKDGDSYHNAYLYTGRDYELFDILNGREDDYFPCRAIYLKNLPVTLQEEINRCQNISGYYDFCEANLADVKFYLKNHPKVRDWEYSCDDDNEEEWEKEAWKDNPVASLIERIEHFIDFFDDYWDWESSYSDVRIIYWFDC